MTAVRAGASDAVNRPARYMVGALVLAIVLFAVFAWRFAHRSTDAIASTPGARRDAVPPLAASSSRTANVAVAVAHAGDLGNAGVSTDDPVTAFEKQNVYPPTSRPLTTAHVDLLQPDRRHETRRSTDADDGVEFLFTADRYFVVGDQTITPQLSAYRGGAQQPITVTQAFAAVLDPKATAESPRFAIAIGKPFAPSTIPQLTRQTALGLFVEFEYGGARQRARISFQYTPAEAISARFTGQFRDA